MATHLLLDFFGTVVDYSPSRTEQGYAATHEVLRSLGSTASYEDFLDVWVRASSVLDDRSAADDSEYSMDEVVDAVLTELLPGPWSPAGAAAVRDSYLAEWSTAVRPVPGVEALLAGLARTWTLVVVTNTHQPDLVPNLLAAAGVDHLVTDVVTSVELGSRKPHPAVYEAALGRSGAAAADAVFVGDTYEADYVGPRRAGMRALLVDPAGRSPVPPEHRLGSVLDLPRALDDLARRGLLGDQREA